LTTSTTQNDGCGKEEVGSSQVNTVEPEDGVTVSTSDTEAKSISQPVEEIITKKDESSKEEATLAAVDELADDGSKGGIHVSDVESVETACVAVTQAASEESEVSANNDEKEVATNTKVDHLHENDNSAWETVEVRSRGNRKKSVDLTGNGRFGSRQSFGSSSHGRRPKGPRSRASRSANIKRKSVRELLCSVLDAVDEEVRRKQQAPRDGSRLPGNKWAAAVAQQSNIQKKDGTMRDALVGKHTKDMSSGLAAGASQAPQCTQGVSDRHGNEQRKGRDKIEKISPGIGTKVTTADQNTAPTVQETLSAVSTNSVNNDTCRGQESRRDAPVRESGPVRSDSSSGTEEVKPQRASSTSQASKEVSLSPPLPTLLSSGNANSVSSSVASSLDATHAGHHHHHSFSADNENGVGYHLLDVCDRLTREMNFFMNRRSHALDVRRKERGAVLVALQESLSVSSMDRPSCVHSTVIYLIKLVHSTVYYRHSGPAGAMSRCTVAVLRSWICRRLILML
jgi:hypothetical protein